MHVVVEVAIDVMLVEAVVVHGVEIVCIRSVHCWLQMLYIKTAVTVVVTVI